MSVPKSSMTMVLAPQIANSTENNQPIVEVKHCNAAGQINEKLRLESKIDLQELVPGDRLSREQSMGDRGLGFRLRSFKRTEKAKTARAKDDTKEDIISLYHDDLSEYSSVSGSGTLSVRQTRPDPQSQLASQFTNFSQLVSNIEH